MKLRDLLGLLICAFSFTIAYGQKGTVRGYVYDKANGTPIVYGNVFVKGTSLGTNTDIEGFFNLSDIPSGDYILVATYIGYDTAMTEIVIKNGTIINKSMYINESTITLGEISVTAERQQAKSEVQISKISVTPQQIKALPSVGGESDIAQYIQVLPGVVSTGDQGGQIYIRGGSPVQNKIILDGLNIYNPFHSLGFYSVFETDVIRNVEVLTGGFNAEHGGRVSAIIDIKTREGNKSKVSGYTSISPFMGKLLIEAPLKKFKEGSGSTSFILTGKKSLIDQTSKKIYNYAVANKDIGLPFSFSDFYGKISHVAPTGSKFNAFGFNYNDKYNDPRVANIGWKNIGVGTSFTLIPTNSSLIIDGVIGYTDYATKIAEADIDRTSGIREFGTNLDFSYFATDTEVKYGFELKGIRTQFDFVNPYRVRIGQEQNTTELSGFFKYRRKFGNLVIEPSVRLMYYASPRVFSPEPRIGLKYNVSDKLRVKAGAGLYSQNVLSTNSERDIVNLFSGFLTGPEEGVKGFDGSRLANNLQKARHGVFGIELDAHKDILINIEGYAKDFNQLIVINRNKLSASESDFAYEQGLAYGAEFSAKVNKPDYTFWLAYTYGFVNRDDGNQVYPTVYDRRHNLNALATYNLDAKGDFQASVRWNLGSGFPFTQTKGFYNGVDFSNGVETDYITSNPKDISIIYSEDRNAGRLPYYHRLDVSLTKNFRFTKYTGLETNISVTNAYDRPNIFYFDRIRYLRVNQLPILPSAGVKFYW